MFSIPRLIKLTLVFAFAVLIASSVAPASAENVRAKVTEVKGAFCKLDAAGPEGIAVGAAGKLYRLSAGAAAQGEVSITSVQAGYSVGKVANGTAQVGDFVLLPKSETTAATTEAKTDDPITVTPAKPVSDRFDELVGKKINIQLSDDKVHVDVKLIRVARDIKTGRLKSLRVEGVEPKSGTTFELAQLKEVTFEGESLELPEVTEADAKSGPQKTRNQMLAEKRAIKEAEEKKAWLERLKAKGIEPWPELTKEEHEAAIASDKEIVEKVKATYQNIQLYETARFLFCTNIPPEQVGPYVVSLDALHNMMCQMYNIKPGTQVWKGKALVVAFLNEEEFMDFERRFMGTSISGAYGVCHQKQNGDVLIACYRGDRVAEFGQMLVHETSHGFIHRYKTPIHFPNWVNEGMADYVGLALVPASRSVPIRERQAVAQMRVTRSMGGDFFTAQNIDAWQYGVASSMAAYMINTDKKAYVKFIEGMKEGLTWEESLKESYKATPEGFVAAYGAAIGVPDLRP